MIRMCPKDERDREAILARRRLMMASALAGIAVTHTACEKPAQPCLSVEVVRDAAPPLPCLSAPLRVTPEAGVEAGAEASAPRDAPPPRPCLEVPVPPKQR